MSAGAGIAVVMNHWSADPEDIFWAGVILCLIILIFAVVLSLIG